MTALVVYFVVAQPGAYQPNREYVYRYEGHVLSGVPKMSSQYAGLKIDCDVVLQFLPGFDVIAKVRDSLYSAARTTKDRRTIVV